MHLDEITRKCGDWANAERVLFERSFRYPEPTRAKVVLANGVYDALHPGHVLNLAKAADLGDLLLVSLDDDEDVRLLKGQPPLFSWRERALMVASLSCVTAVTWHSRCPCWKRPAGDCSLPTLIRRIGRDIWAARACEALPLDEVAAARSAYTRVVRLDRHGPYSSTAIRYEIEARPT